MDQENFALLIKDMWHFLGTQTDAKEINTKETFGHFQNWWEPYIFRILAQRKGGPDRSTVCYEWWVCDSEISRSVSAV